MPGALRGFLLCASILLLSVVMLGAQDSPFRSCVNTKKVMESLKRDGLPSAVNEIYSSLRPAAGTMCQLDETCCSSKVEGIFQGNTVQNYQDTIKSALTDELSQCSKPVLFEKAISYIEQAKNQLVQDLLVVYQSFFHGNEMIFDEMYSYLVRAIQTGDIADLPQVFHQMFFEVYLSTYLAFPGTDPLPESMEVRDCFYMYFQKSQAEDLENWFKGFQRGFTKIMHYFRALRAADVVIDTAVKHVVTEQCELALVKMEDCALCAGYSAFSSRTCNGLCLNILRGCLMDLSDLVEPIQSFSEVLIAMKDHITTFSLFGQIELLETHVFGLIGTISDSIVTVRNELESNCLNSQRKRSVSNREKRVAGEQEHLVPRSEISRPLQPLNDSAYCLLNRVDAFSKLPDTLCGRQASKINKVCWNGHTLGSYSRKVMNFKRTSQANNPELLICPNAPSQFQFEVNLLRQMTTELASISGTCSTDDEDCGEVKPITAFYDFSSVSSTGVTQVVEGEEGSGSGSGSVGELCLSQNSGTTEFVVAESGSPPVHSLSAILLVAMTLTVLLLAIGSPWSL